MVANDKKNSLFPKKIDLQNKPAFLERLAILLTEGYTFNDGVALLLPHHLKDYQPVLASITNDLKGGYGVTAILGRLGYKKETLLPVAIAEVDGQFVLALNGTAVRLRKSEEKNKRLKKLLIYPIVLFIFIAVLMFAFRLFFLPNMEALAISRQSDVNRFVSSLPFIATKIPDLLVGFLLVSTFITVVSFCIYKKLHPQNKIRFLLAIPVLGTFYSVLKTRDFSSEMGGLLLSGLSMQNALDVLIDQEMDVVQSEMARNVKEQVIYGESFHNAVLFTKGLTKQLSAFAKHGADSGYLSKELIIYSEHLDETIDEQLSRGLSMLQPILFGIIAVCILAAYLALLLPVYGMMDKL